MRKLVGARPRSWNPMSSRLGAPPEGFQLRWFGDSTRNQGGATRNPSLRDGTLSAFYEAILGMAAEADEGAKIAKNRGHTPREGEACRAAHADQLPNPTVDPKSLGLRARSHSLGQRLGRHRPPGLRMCERRHDTSAALVELFLEFYVCDIRSVTQPLSTSLVKKRSWARSTRTWQVRIQRHPSASVASFAPLREHALESRLAMHLRHPVRHIASSPSQQHWEGGR